MCLWIDLKFKFFIAVTNQGHLSLSHPHHRTCAFLFQLSLPFVALIHRSAQAVQSSSSQRLYPGTYLSMRSKWWFFQVIRLYLALQHGCYSLKESVRGNANLHLIQASGDKIWSIIAAIYSFIILKSCKAVHWYLRFLFGCLSLLLDFLLHFLLLSLLDLSKLGGKTIAEF